jgi:hypothetical protein
MTSARLVTILLALGPGTVSGGRGGVLPSTTSGADSMRTTVVGTVYDSIARRPLPSAVVQLVGAGDTTAASRYGARTDAAGRFTIAGVAPGEYVAVFGHPALDSLGLEAERLAVRVAGATQRVDLASPSARTVARIVCPRAEQPDSMGLVMGHVRRAGDESPLVGATVDVRWTEWTSVTGDIGSWRPRQRHAAAETTENGWFALCDVPGGAPLMVHAAFEADTSGFVRVTVPPGELRHLTWHVGAGMRAGTGARTPVMPTSLWRGAARLSGRVRDRAGQPIANARASVWGAVGDRATDARGSFTLDSLPGGTQTLEVRALGYAPEQVVVHLVPGRSSQVDVTLGDRVTELAPVTVRATESRGLRLDAFYDRMKDAERGINRGYFFTPEELERRNPPLITNIFDEVPGLLVDRRDGNRKAKVRGILRDPSAWLNRCEMSVFLDGIQIIGGMRDIPGLGSPSPHQDSIDEVVPAAHVAAVEIYPHPVMAPPQYQRLNGTCGIILLWTK